MHSACRGIKHFLAVMLLLNLLTAIGCSQQPATKSAPVPGIALNNVIDLVSSEVTAEEDGKTKFTLTFLCKNAMDAKYRLLFHGYVKDEELIPPEKRNKYKFLNADHEPVRPTNTWRPGETVVHTISLNLKPGEYNFHLGLFDRHTSKALQGKPIELGWMHLPPKP